MVQIQDLEKLDLYGQLSSPSDSPKLKPRSIASKHRLLNIADLIEDKPGLKVVRSKPKIIFTAADDTPRKFFKSRTAAGLTATPSSSSAVKSSKNVFSPPKTVSKKSTAKKAVKIYEDGGGEADGMKTPSRTLTSDAAAVASSGRPKRSTRVKEAAAGTESSAVKRSSRKPTKRL